MPSRSARLLPLALVLAACNALSGLDGFTKGAEPGPGLEPVEAGVDALIDAPIDAPVDAPIVPPPPPPPPPSDAGVDSARAWAQWRMPGPDAAYTQSGETVRDETTRLVWSRTTTTASSFEEADRACRDAGMVVPTRIELASLLDLSRDAAPLLPRAFDPDAGALMWTVSPYRGPGPVGGRWTVSFATAEVAPGTASHVRCVQAMLP